MLYLYIQSGRFKNQVQYVFDTIFYILGMDCICIQNNSMFEIGTDDIIIEYLDDVAGADCLDAFNNRILIKNSKKLFGNDYLKADSIPQKVERYVLQSSMCGIDDIVVLYRGDGEPYVIEEDHEKHTIVSNIDMISGIFFMLTRYEEIVNSKTAVAERYKRFPAKESIAYKNHFLHRPIVNEYIELIWSWIESFNLGYKRKNFWGKKSFAVCLSHDVDRTQKYSSAASFGKHAVSLILKHMDLKGGACCLLEYIKSSTDYKKDPFWTFEYITGIEKSLGFTSSFYFISGGVSSLDKNYCIYDEKVKKLIVQLKCEGFEVGYHGSFNSFDNIELMQREKLVIDQLVSGGHYGCRQHFLRFKAPYTWRYQEQCGIMYDSTLSYADCEGFRCGICFPYKPYDILSDRVLDIWEIPLQIMEGTLFDKNYRSLTAQEGLRSILDMILKVKRHKGVFTMLWHNSSFDYDWTVFKPVFEKVMEYLGTSDCCGMSGRDIIKSVKGG